MRPLSPSAHRSQRAQHRSSVALRRGRRPHRCLRIASIVAGVALGAAATPGLVSGPAYASGTATYYASPTGSGSSCSSSSRCSLSSALSDAAGAGNSGVDVTVDLAAGTYGSVAITSGSEASLTLDGAGSSSTVISGGGSATALDVELTTFPVTADNVEITDGSGYCAGVSTGNVCIEGATVNLGSDLITANGTAAYGGGVFVDGTHAATVAITNTTISNDLASAIGGGISVGDNGTVVVKMTIADSTITDNTASTGDSGAGIRVNESTVGSSLIITDSTIDGNSTGDAVYDTGTVPTMIYGTTIASNAGYGIEDTTSGANAKIQLGADIVANNSSGECLLGGSSNITDEGYNFADDSSCDLTAGTSRQNLSDANLFPGSPFGSLASNGGATETARISASSDAYDVVPTGTTLTGESSAFCSGSDQRGMARTQAGASSCDAGAYQVAPPSLSGTSSSSAEAGVGLTVSGTNLAFARAATFGASDTAGTITAQSATSLSVTVPSLSPGSQAITVTNPDGSAQLAFNAVADPSVTAVSLGDAEVGVAYGANLSASGGATPLGWSVSSGTLPSGLALSSGGAISGTPSVSGTSSFTARVSDVNGVAGTKALSLDVVPALSVTTSSLPGATAGDAYSAALSVASGTGQSPFNWSVSSGTLPPGLALSGAGVLSGVPKSPGSSSFTVGVSDALGGSVHERFSLDVAAASTTASTTAGVRWEPRIVITSGRVLQRGSVVPVKLSCRVAACAGVLALTEQVVVSRKLKKTIVKRRETFLLAKASYRIAKGGHAVVDLRLDPRGRRVLGSVAKHPRRERLVAAVRGGRTMSKSVVVA